MELSFENKELRKICEDKEEAIYKFGKDVSTQLQNRLSDIFAAESVEDIIAGNPRKTGEHPYLFYVINLTNEIELKFCANNSKKKYLDNGELDWTAITRIKLINIQSNHG